MISRRAVLLTGAALGAIIPTRPFADTLFAEQSITVQVYGVFAPTTFGSVTGAGPDRPVTSAEQTIAGLPGPVDVSLEQTGSGREFRINGGAWRSTPISGVINGDRLQVRLTSAVTGLTMTSLSLRVGEQSVPFSVTTKTLSNPTFVTTGSDVMPAHSAGDLVFALALRRGGTEPITVPEGWTTLNQGSFSSVHLEAWVSCYAVLVYRYAPIANSVTASFVGATRVLYSVYRNATVSPVVSVRPYFMASWLDYLSYNANSVYPNTAWSVVFTGWSRISNSPGGTIAALANHTHRRTLTGTGSVHLDTYDSNGARAGFAQDHTSRVGNQTQGGGYVTFVARVGPG